MKLSARDRTNRERDHLKGLQAELDRRIKSGEKNITIKYINGIPNIVNSAPKNG
jgi:hypothetical protein